MKESNDGTSVLAELQLLALDAPSFLLQPGSKFELYEGHRLVARGEVLQDGIEPSAKTIRTHSNIEMTETQ